MIPSENLIASVLLAFLTFIFWETGRILLQKIKKFLKRSPSQNPGSKKGIATEKENLLKNMKKEASTIMGQGYMMGTLIKERILKEARQEAQKIIREAKDEIEKTRLEAFNVLQKDIADLAVIIDQQLKKNLIEFKTSQRVINTYLNNHNSNQSESTSQINRLS